ncbi:hypothetical protein [Ancylobacter mangrovi]|uniref:DUF4148 domain-containing protein n=1 Tax=Ancylobacter mangrovi TaxID=2972472 RepID=A0A9X2PH53_9HYPH|nr:hypothetical protein [Ancylobacter mangrovi]MCS0497314.1 hypothetical protein [Ancylobacter mangrovi]MCS0504136.1 hypothetical protein [Ancylobacter mangrovi]
MISKTISIAVLAATFALPVTVSVPAYATSTSTKPLPKIGSYEQRDVLERERVRRKQVQDNRHNGLFEPLTAPLYQGRNSPVQRVERAFD